MRSAELDEPMAGRAGFARAWLAVEHPGPWPRDAVEAALSPILAGVELEGVRVVLIRKRGGGSLPRHPRVFLAWSAGPRSWIRATRIGGYEELVDLVQYLGEQEPDVGERSETAVVLVCTHGRRDACCAEFGRPILGALRDRADADVWESTHVGGDRFAANVVILPEGLHYSRLTPSNANLPLDAYARNELHLPSFRGRASRTMPEQAAEHAIRARTGQMRIDDVTILHTTRNGDQHHVLARVAERRFAVQLRAAAVAPGGVRHGCHGGADVADWTKWELISVAEAP
ncbi:sucrase ferredoxin [Agreia bicolorata]|uniref:sucrase ferredoxin n=1 Tax=Agreia bicolorata TaxID=110935 RepID=UPI0015927200|nr:sucrase ferredoxin [Agreia bicolorata]